MRAARMQPSPQPRIRRQERARPAARNSKSQAAVSRVPNAACPHPRSLNGGVHPGDTSSPVIQSSGVITVAIEQFEKLEARARTNLQTWFNE